MFWQSGIITKCFLLPIVLLQHTLFIQINGKAQYPFQDATIPFPMGPPFQPYQQGGFIRDTPFIAFPNRPFVQGHQDAQVLILPDNFHSPDIRIRPSVGSQSFFMPNFPVHIPTRTQVPFSPIFPLMIQQISSDAFNRPAPLENLLKQYFTNTRSNENKTCSYFSNVGVCQNHAVCAAHGGRPTTYCRDVTKFCCLYRWSCDLMTEQKVGYFRNPDYPLSSQITTSCGITIRKIHMDICTIRVEPMKLDLPANIGFCEDLSFNADGIPGKDYEPLCGNLADKTYDVDITSTSTITLRINTNRPSRLVWNVKITQIPCEEGSFSSWPQIGTIGLHPPPQSPPEISEGVIAEVASPGTTVVDVAPPGTITTGISAPVITHNVCGIPHKRSGLNVRDRGPFSPTAASFLRLQQFLQGFGTPLLPTRDDEEDDCDDKRFGGQCTLQATRQNPLLQTLEWKVPSVNDSILYKYAGNPKPVGLRITYGKTTAPHTHPWNIAMYNNGRFHCGATLISDRHVLTAAHCVIKSQRRPEKLKLSIGDWDINSNSDGPSIDGNIAKIITHPGYSTHTLKYDVAVLTLKESVQFSDTIVPVCLPTNEMNIEGKIITVSGWGRDEKNRLQSQLMAHNAAVVSNNLCNDRWEQKGAPKGIIANTMLCMDPQDGDSCKGDSGGPAIMEFPPNSNRFIQVGIVSFGSASCTDKNLPGVYTKVSAVSDWIMSQMIS